MSLTAKRQVQWSFSEEDIIVQIVPFLSSGRSVLLQPEDFCAEDFCAEDFYAEDFCAEDLL